MIDCIQYRTANSNLFYFLKENKCASMELRLLRFWGQNPKARLSLYTIATALDTASFNLRQTITSLVKKGILKELSHDNRLITYTLTIDRQVQEYIGDLGKLDANEIRIMEKQLEGEAILV